MSKTPFNPEKFNLRYTQIGLDFMWEIKYKEILIDRSEKPCSYEAMVFRLTQTVEASKTLH